MCATYVILSGSAVQTCRSASKRRPSRIITGRTRIQVNAHERKKKANTQISKLVRARVLGWSGRQVYSRARWIDQSGQSLPAEGRFLENDHRAGNGRSGQRKRATEGALFRPLRRRLLDCWVGREELLLVSRWPSQPALSLDLIASAEDYGRPLQRDCGQRRQAGLFGGTDRAFARFHRPLKKRFGPGIFPLA